MKDKKGIALILAVGILALLAGIATSFALNMRLEYKAALNYHNGVKANYLAEAAAERAIHELKTDVQANAFDDLTEQWAASPAYTNTVSGDTAVSAILDEQRKVNVNTANQTLLENLFNAIGGLDATALYTKINTNRPYIYLQELMSKGTLTETEYNAIKNDVSISTHVDPSTTRSPVNINTCSDDVLRAILTGLSDGSTTVSGATVNSVVTAIQGARPITTWAQFEQEIDNSGIPVSEATIIKDNCNSNKTPPSTYTTKFCFNSGGYYEITGTGDILMDGVSVATRDVKAIVGIYNIYARTTKEDFRGEDANYDGVIDAGEDINENTILDVPSHDKVTWFDSCPVNSTDLFGSYTIPSNAETIPGSLKLGFWDDFDEDQAYTLSELQNLGNGSIVFQDVNGDGDNEITDSGFGKWPKYVLEDFGDSTRWDWSNFSLRAYERDDEDWIPDKQMRRVGWVCFRGYWGGRPATLHATDGNLSWDDVWWAYPAGGRPGSVEFLDDDGARAKGYDPPSAFRYLYAAQIRTFPDTNHDYDSLRTLLAYDTQKTFNLHAQGNKVTTTVYTSVGSNGTLVISGVSTTPGKIAIYGDLYKVAWDDLRIISDDSGIYTSESFRPQDVDSGINYNVNWGTVVATVTIPTSAEAATGVETVTLQTRSGTETTTDIWRPLSGDGSDSLDGTYIQYEATLSSTGEADYKETPVLEDITMTYLPKSKMASYTVSP